MDHDKKEIMKTTVELVSAYMQAINANGMRTDKTEADAYADFIETIYNKVEFLTK